MPIESARKEAGFVANYRHIPAPSEIRPAIVGTGGVPLSHARPIPGGISARLTFRWTAHTPILVGDDRASGTVMPQRLFKHGSTKGPWCITGSELRAMVKAAYMVVTGSAFVPVNITHRVTIRGTNQPNKRALKRADFPGQPAPKNSFLNGIQTIRKVAERTYGTGPIMDWTTALFGFVKDEESADVWMPTIDHGAPALKGRVSFGFATSDRPDDARLWPNEDLVIPGAGPKITFEAGYLRNEDKIPTGDYWKVDSENTVMAGLKVYPVHEPNRARVKEYVRSEVKSDRRRNGKRFPAASDTCLRFLDAKEGRRLRFTGTIECHNLHPDEFGALIWAITLGQEACLWPGGEEPTYRHNIGHLRAYGFGQITPELVGGQVSVNPTAEDPHGLELVDEDCREFLGKRMGEFLEAGNGGEHALADRLDRCDLFLKYKNPAVGKCLLEKGYLKPLPPLGGPNMNTLMGIYREIREQPQTISDWDQSCSQGAAAERRDGGLPDTE